MTGRVVETTLYEITGQLSESHIKLYFQISGLKGARADTVFAGHEYQRDYLRSLVRRGSSRVDDILDVTTKDGYVLRVSVVAFTVSRIRSSTKVTLRELMRSKVREKSEQLNFDQYIQEIVLGKVASEIYNEGKTICPLRHVGIRKSKLISKPEKGAMKPLPEEKEQEAESTESD
jgi:small subunit ribosomal protein S3Ae